MAHLADWQITSLGGIGNCKGAWGHIGPLFKDKLQNSICTDVIESSNVKHAVVGHMTAVSVQPSIFLVSHSLYPSSGNATVKWTFKIRAFCFYFMYTNTNDLQLVLLLNSSSIKLPN